MSRVTGRQGLVDVALADSTVPSTSTGPIVIPTSLSTAASSGGLSRPPQRLSSYVAISGGISLLCNKEFPLLAIKRFVEEYPEFGLLRIVASYAYVSARWKSAPHQWLAPHRFVLLRLHPELGDPIWLRLERYPVSKVALVRGLGVTDAKDTGLFFGDTKYIQSQQGYKLENTQEFTEPFPTLQDLCRIIDVVMETIPHYTLWPQNCWMLSSLVQDLLATVAEVSHMWAPVIHRNLWPAVLTNSKRRLRQLYHIPEPISVAVMLHTLQVDVRFFPVQKEITCAIDAYNKWELSVQSVSRKSERQSDNPIPRKQRRLLPCLINNIDTITAEMDSLGQHAEAASIWRQMILVLRRSAAGLPGDYMFFLALATEQYGIYLAICARPGARTADSEALAIAKALGPNGIADSTEYCLSYWLFRQRALFEDRKYAEASSEASRLVDRCRRLHIADPKKHTHKLALSLFWHSRSLKSVGRHCDAEQAFREAMDIHLLESLNWDSSGEPWCNSSLGMDAGMMPPPADQPVRFMQPLANQLFIVGFDERNEESYGVATEATRRASALIRTLYRFHSDTYASRLAWTLQQCGVLIRSCGDYEAARDALRHAIEHTRRLYWVHPNQYRHRLAGWLKYYSFFLIRCSQFEAARDADAEAIELTRELCCVHPDLYCNDLADQLEFYSNTLSLCGQSEAARKVSAEVVEITRELYQVHPDQHRSDFSRRLQTYGFSLAKRGSLKTARDVQAEALQHTRELYNVHPDQYCEDLVKQLHICISLLGRGRQPEAACVADAKAVEFERELHEVRPDEYRHGLARQLRQYGNSLTERGQFDAARDVEAEAVGLTRELHRIDPDQSRHDLTECISSSTHTRQRPEATCDADAEAMELTRELYRIHPDQYRSDLAQRLHRHSFSLGDCGETEAARDASAEAVELTQELYQICPDRYQDDLAARLQSYGFYLGECGQYEEARGVEAEAAKIARELHRVQPNEYRGDIADRLQDYRVSLSQCGQPQAAEEAEAEAEALEL